MSESRFKVGDEVIIHNSGLGEYLLKRKVFKVYKNGNFIVEKGGQQYTQNGGSTNTHAYHIRVYPYTDEAWNRLGQPLKLKNYRAELIKLAEETKSLEALLAAVDILKDAQGEST